MSRALSRDGCERRGVCYGSRKDRVEEELSEVKQEVRKLKGDERIRSNQGVKAGVEVSC